MDFQIGLARWLINAICEHSLWNFWGTSVTEENMITQVKQILWGGLRTSFRCNQYDTRWWFSPWTILCTVKLSLAFFYESCNCAGYRANWLLWTSCAYCAVRFYPLGLIKIGFYGGNKNVGKIWFFLILSTQSPRAHTHTSLISCELIPSIRFHCHTNTCEHTLTD